MIGKRHKGTFQRDENVVYLDWVYTGVNLKKTHNQKVENYVLFGYITEDYIAQESASQIVLRNCSKEVREEPGYIGVFAEKNKKRMCSQTSKDYC